MVPWYFGLLRKTTATSPATHFLASSESHRGKDILEAFRCGNVRAVQHFLRVDPASVKARDDLFGHSLGAAVESLRTSLDIHSAG